MRRYYKIVLECFGNPTTYALLKLGGKEETFGEKSKRKTHKIIREYENKIKKLEERFDNLEEEYARKSRELEKQYQEKEQKLQESFNSKMQEFTDNYFLTIQGQLEWQERSIRVLNGVIKYKSSEERVVVLDAISRKKLLIGKMREELQANVVNL